MVGPPARDNDGLELVRSWFSITLRRDRRQLVDRADEITVNELAAQLYGYEVGQQLDLGTYSTRSWATR